MPAALIFKSISSRFLAEDVEVVVFERRRNGRCRFAARGDGFFFREDSEDCIAGLVVAGDVGHAVFLLELDDLAFGRGQIPDLALDLCRKLCGRRVFCGFEIL